MSSRPSARAIYNKNETSIRKKIMGFYDGATFTCRDVIPGFSSHDDVVRRNLGKVFKNEVKKHGFGWTVSIHRESSSQAPDEYIYRAPKTAATQRYSPPKAQMQNNFDDELDFDFDDDDDEIDFDFGDFDDDDDVYPAAARRPAAQKIKMPSIRTLKLVGAAVLALAVMYFGAVLLNRPPSAAAQVSEMQARTVRFQATEASTVARSLDTILTTITETGGWLYPAVRDQGFVVFNGRTRGGNFIEAIFTNFHLIPATGELRLDQVHGSFFIGGNQIIFMDIIDMYLYWGQYPIANPDILWK